MTRVEEDDLNAFVTIYQDALHALASDPQTACEAMGNDNAPWEIRDGVGSHAYLADSPVLALTAEQADAMRRLAAGVKALPEAAIAPGDVATTGRTACVTAMRHPAWVPLRTEAAELADMLEEAFAQSEDRLYGD